MIIGQDLSSSKAERAHRASQISVSVALSQTPSEAQEHIAWCARLSPPSSRQPHIIPKIQLSTLTMAYLHIET